ncbi:hypothetical protein Esti_003079 [Eimeria stiedai]
MYSKLAKCKFAAQSVEYLGYRVGAYGIHPSTEKMSAIALWPTELANETQLRQFLGNVNYCRNFMGPEFAVFAGPLQQLLKQKAPFQWTAAHSSAAQVLKDRLIHYTKLSLLDLTMPFILRTDASGVAIGSALEQDGKPLGFLSKRLSNAKMSYSTYDQELLAIVRALYRWRHFLITADHLNIVHQPGATNVVADALSRCSAYKQDLQHTSSKVLLVSSIPPPAPQQSCISASNPPEPAVRASLLLVRAKVGRRPTPN